MAGSRNLWAPGVDTVHTRIIDRIRGCYFVQPPEAPGIQRTAGEVAAPGPAPVQRAVMVIYLRF